MHRRSLPALALLAVSIALTACQPAITQVSPSDGVLLPDGTVTVSGSFVNVSPANAIVLVNGSPAIVSGSTFSLGVALEPGANSILVELRDASNPAVRKRERIAVIRGQTVAPQAFVQDGAALRANDSFFEALPTRALAEAGLAGFVEDNEFFQGGLGAQLVDCLLDAAGSAEVDTSDDDGIRLTISPDCPDMEGEHTFDLPGPFDVTCRVTMSLGGSAWVEGDLEPDPADPAGLEFAGTAGAAWEFDYDVDDPGTGPCDGSFPEFDGLATAILDFVAEVALPNLAETAADALRLEAEARVAGRGFRLRGELEGVEEIDDAVQIRGDVLTEPLGSHGQLTLRVPDALPVPGPVTPAGALPYDLALALTPTALNQLLAAATSQGFLAADLTTQLTGEAKIIIAALFPDHTSHTVRLDVRVPPVLDGTLVCPGTLDLPRLQLANARVFLEGVRDGKVEKLLVIAVDVDAGARLRPESDASGNEEAAFELVVDPACPDTTFVAVVLHESVDLDDAGVESFVVSEVTKNGVVAGVPPLPIGKLVSLDDLAGQPAGDLGFEIVEVEALATSMSVYLNLLVDGFDDWRVRVESDFGTASVDGWTYLLGDIEHEPSGGTGGANDGYVHGEPNLENDTSYFVAPAKFLGDWRGYDGLRVSLQSRGGTYYDSSRGYRGDVYLANGAMTAQYDFGRRPAATWERFTVPLEDGGGWTLGGGAASLDDVLENVTEFHVRGEYGVGSDDADLDEVQLVVE